MTYDDVLRLPQKAQEYVLELRRALRVTAAELSTIRAGCWALRALLEEYGFPIAEDVPDARLGYELARALAHLRAVHELAREDHEAKMNENSRRWIALREAIVREPEYAEAAKTGRVDLEVVAVAVLERLRTERP